MTEANQILRAEAVRYRRLEALTTDGRVAVILHDMAIACDQRIRVLNFLGARH